MAISTRVQRFLASGVRRDGPRDADTIAQKLRRAKLPVSPAAIAFEQTFGCYQWYPNENGPMLGLEYSTPWMPPGHPRIAERSELVSLGNALGTSEYDSVCLDRAGEVFQTSGPRHRSVEHYLERSALFWGTSWSRPLSIQLGSRLGEPLASALGLELVVEATDAYQQCWSGEHLALQHYVTRDQGEVSAVDWAVAETVTHAVKLIVTALELDPTFAASVGPLYGVERETLTEDWQRARESWKHTEGVVRLPVGTMWNDIAGEMWLVPSVGSWEVHELLFQTDGRLREWYTTTDTRSVGR